MTDHLDPEDLHGAWDRLDPEDHNEVMLWRAVVAQALRDMVSVDTELALEAAVWLGTEDYKNVCDLALLDHCAVEAAIRHIMKTEHPLYRKAEATSLADTLTVWPQDRNSERDEAA